MSTAPHDCTIGLDNAEVQQRAAAPVLRIGIVGLGTVDAVYILTPNR